jgi:hypothetical protein
MACPWTGVPVILRWDGERVRACLAGAREDVEVERGVDAAARTQLWCTCVEMQTSERVRQVREMGFDDAGVRETVVSVLMGSGVEKRDAEMVVMG